MNKSIRLEIVNFKNIKLAQSLQEDIFPNEKSPRQLTEGVYTNNPINFIAYFDNKPIGIVGVYFQKNLPEHVMLNWFGVIKSYRGRGFGREILKQTIEFIKSDFTDIKFLTLYTGKIENKIAINLYSSLNFHIEDYCCDEDIAELNKMGIENNFVICILKLKDADIVDLKKINLKIAKQFQELSKYN